ncbi:MAG TPA: hypothetical protein VK497_01980 [Candidatus Saccharimonadales bacterium]|nr:hypothetical protein [Candidatus Saccharimonadales bacterium]
MDVITLVTVFVFVGVIQLSARFKFHPVLSSSLVVFSPFLLTLLLRSIFFSQDGFSLYNLLSWRDIVVVILQFLASLLLFYKIRYEEDSLAAWFGWSLAGMIIIFLAIPFLVRG